MSDFEIRFYFGKRFYKAKDGYWKNMMPIHAHRWVWINHFGAIAEGMDIHHKDGNKSNNDIENLEMLSRSDHLKKEMSCPKRKERQKKLLNTIRPMAHEVMRTEEKRKEQSEKSKEAWKYRRKRIKICIGCKMEYETTQPWAKCCNPTCYTRWRRKQLLK